MDADHITPPPPGLTEVRLLRITANYYAKMTIEESPINDYPTASGLEDVTEPHL